MQTKHIIDRENLKKNILGRGIKYFMSISL